MNTVQAVNQVYKAEIAPCPRSPEWKTGALAGMYKAALQPYDHCPNTSGTAQADAWAAGFQYGYADYCHRTQTAGTPA